MNEQQLLQENGISSIYYENQFINYHQSFDNNLPPSPPESQYQLQISSFSSLSHLFISSYIY